MDILNMVNEHMKSREESQVNNVEKGVYSLSSSDIKSVKDKLTNGENLILIEKTYKISIDNLKDLLFKKGFLLLWIHKNVAARFVSDIPLVIRNIVGDLNKGISLTEVLQKFGYKKEELYNKLNTYGYHFFPVSVNKIDSSLASTDVGSFTLIRNIEDGLFNYIEYLKNVTLTTAQINTLLGVNSIYYSFSAQNRADFIIRDHYFHLNKYEVENITKADPSLSFLRTSPYLFTYKGLCLIAKNAKREDKLDNRILKEFFPGQESIPPINSLKDIEDLYESTQKNKKLDIYSDLEKWTDIPEKEVNRIIEENLSKGKSLIDISANLVKDRSLRSQFADKLMKKLEGEGYSYDTKATRWVKKSFENAEISEQPTEETDLVSKLVSLINSGKPMHFVVQDHGLNTHQARSMFKSAGYIFNSKTYKWENHSEGNKSIESYEDIKELPEKDNLKINVRSNQSVEQIEKRLPLDNNQKTTQEKEQAMRTSEVSTSTFSQDEVETLKKMLSEWKEHTETEEYYELKIRIKKSVFKQLNVFAESEELPNSKVIELALNEFFK
jgi:hypothetical protein